MEFKRLLCFFRRCELNMAKSPERTIVSVGRESNINNFTSFFEEILNICSFNVKREIGSKECL
jgi:hypothetical protein